MADDALLEKLDDLNAKVERLNEERNRLLESNKKLVELLMLLEEFLETNVDPSTLHSNADSPLDDSMSIDIDDINEQALQVQRMIDEMADHNV